jgi:hypothetical protein
MASKIHKAKKMVMYDVWIEWSILIFSVFFFVITLTPRLCVAYETIKINADDYADAQSNLRK